MWTERVTAVAMVVVIGMVIVQYIGLWDGEGDDHV